jgi:hypothetical protein
MSKRPSPAHNDARLRNTPFAAFQKCYRAKRPSIWGRAWSPFDMPVARQTPLPTFRNLSLCEPTGAERSALQTNLLCLVISRRQMRTEWRTTLAKPARTLVYYAPHDSALSALSCLFSLPRPRTSSPYPQSDPQTPSQLADMTIWRLDVRQ